MIPILMAVCAAGVLCGCVSVQMGTRPEKSTVDVSGLADGYMQVTPIPKYDGNILTMNLLKGGGDDMVSFDLWPLCGVGVGFVGARVNLLWLDAGLGTLGYHPRPRKVAGPRDKQEPESGRTVQDGDRD
jgi:hypothetical protein